MSREVRMVPASWEHPKNEQGHHIPLFDGSFSKRAAEWDEGASRWDKGFVQDYTTDGWKPKDASHTDIASFADWDGERPDEKDYMPDWSDTERTHYQMYESVTEGTPISPVMESPEALARWLADNKASAGPYATATYDQWLAMIEAGSSVGSFVMNRGTGECMSGVEAVSRLTNNG
jgi:hypothetical protein